MDDPVLKDITNLKEPYGSKRIAIAMQIEAFLPKGTILDTSKLGRIVGSILKLMTDNGILIKVKYQESIAPSSPSRDVKTSPLLLDAKKDSDGNEILTSSLLLDGKKYPPKAEMNGDKVFTSLLLLDEKKDALRAENNGNKALTKADIDAELKKMRNMTPQDAAAAAAEAVKEAEAAIAEAEVAVMEAEIAECEAEIAAEAEAFAKAANRALKWKKLRT